MFLKHISQARCPLWGRDSGKRNSQPGTVPTAGTRLRKEKQSTRHGAHCRDEAQKRETISQTRCPLRGRGSEKRNNQPGTVPTAGTRLREEAPSSATYGAHCCDETHEEGAIQKAVEHRFFLNEPGPPDWLRSCVTVWQSLSLTWWPELSVA